MVIEELEQHDWYVDIIYYLKNLTSPNHLADHKRRALRLKASKFCFINQGLGWRNLEGLILRCVDPEESKKLMDEFHKGLCGGHHATRTTTHKILRGGYYWPEYIFRCPQICKIMSTLSTLHRKTKVGNPPFTIQS
jgi:hypothetical protein